MLCSWTQLRQSRGQLVQVAQIENDCSRVQLSHDESLNDGYGRCPGWLFDRIPSSLWIFLCSPIDKDLLEFAGDIHHVVQPAIEEGRWLQALISYFTLSPVYGSYGATQSFGIIANEGGIVPLRQCPLHLPKLSHPHNQDPFLPSCCSSGSEPSAGYEAAAGLASCGYYDRRVRSSSAVVQRPARSKTLDGTEPVPGWS